MTKSFNVELLASDLNAQGGVYCPSPKADMKIWNSHPKVYLDGAREGSAKCPYCGTVYSRGLNQSGGGWNWRAVSDLLL